MQKLISGPTKVHTAAISFRRPLWLGTSCSSSQGGNPTSVSDNSIPIKRTKDRAALWLQQLTLLSCNRDLGRRPPPAKAAAMPGFAICVSDNSFPLHPVPYKTIPDHVLLGCDILWGGQLPVQAKSHFPSYVLIPKHWKGSVLLRARREVTSFTAYFYFPKIFVRWANRFKYQKF